MTPDEIIKEAEEILTSSRPLRHHNYILDGKNPVPCHNLFEWAAWLENANRTVARTETTNGIVSTVFLGINCNWSDTGKPILFETMVFDGLFDGDYQRYSTWEEAEEGHTRKVKYVTELDEL